MAIFHYSTMYQGANNALHYSSGIIINIDLASLKIDGGYQQFIKQIAEIMDPPPPSNEDIVVLSLSRIGD